MNTERLFDDIAPTYDRLNRILSFGRDQAWRRAVAARVARRRPRRLLDLATGTGDQLLACVQAGIDAEGAVGVDVSGAMLEIARKKSAWFALNTTVRWEKGEAAALPFEAGSFDAVTMSFGIRNMPDIGRVLGETHRVLGPGGLAAILELSVPARPVLRRLHGFYCRFIMPAVGGIVSGNLTAYRYLNESVLQFPDPATFCEQMRSAGFADVAAHTLTFGSATMFTGGKGK
ncbi:MAG: bifunctional demethylmenaquinone methyltransferase/2-methoxy-6-polyprenyl-1,4-benzoquinol methylase UbiE [Kiritimatiellae bacterium]|nr:bifunctional demethylmenaquinone methyltransferase/2-methoxy-6-polyprenyl-1,4-benzoquinol methylase UbiE [Kiritimatiellia bacterium]